MTPITDWRVSGDDNVQPNTGGIYPTLEWVSPSYKTDDPVISFSPAFCTRDLVLIYQDGTPKLRDSFNFNQLYQNTNYK